MREFCGAAGEYSDCLTISTESESGGQGMRFEGGLFRMFASGTSELEQKYIYRPLA